MQIDSHEATVTGGRTLEMFSDTPRYNEWLYSKFAQHVRGRVLEVGSGIGNMSRLLRQDAAELYLTDIEEHYVEVLAGEFADPGRVHVCKYDLAEAPPDSLERGTFDAIMAINVIEHIQDDMEAVKNLHDLLKPGGRLLAYVPACQFAYGSVDEALGHYRRYTR